MKIDNLPNTIYYKIGAVSELTGIPVTTIRDWENRYQAFIPTKTGGNHRMYKQSDIERAQLFKQLSEKGQSISTIAKLSNEELQNLLRNYKLAQLSTRNSNTDDSLKGVTPFSPASALEAFYDPKVLQAGTRLVHTAVVGLSLARRLEGAKFIQAFDRARLQLNHVFMDMHEAKDFGENLKRSNSSQQSPQSQLIVISQNALQQLNADEIDSLNQTNLFQKMIVLYQFAPSAVLDSLRNKNIILKREPLTEGELAELISSVLVFDTEQTIATFSSTQNQSFPVSNSLALIPPRKYSDETLLRVATMPTNIFCECPQHVSEIISHLTSFEKYSQDCLSQTHDDKELHGYLSSVSGTARALFELALEKLAAYEGIALEP